MNRSAHISSIAEAAFFCLMMSVVCSFLLVKIDTGAFRTTLLFVGAALFGILSCNATIRELRDSRLRMLRVFWMAKLCLTIFLLYAGWIPELDPGASPLWGYDPQRYYQQAYELIQSGWKPTGSLNYQGIVYYYGVIFYLFGHNPVSPALINACLTLFCTLYLIRFAYTSARASDRYGWMLAYLVLIPEVLWYDVMTSRETLAAALIILSCIAAGRKIITATGPAPGANLYILTISLAALLTVRTSMALSVAVSVILMALFAGSERKLIERLTAKWEVASIVLVLAAAGPAVQNLLGGYEVSYGEMLASAESFEDNVASHMEWSENSVGLLLAPSTAWQAVLYIPARMVLYLLAPLPNVAVSLLDLLSGSWSAWQKLFTVASSIANLLVMPYVIAAAVYAIGQRRHGAALILVVSFWTNFCAIAGANIIIHERYRLMASLLLFANAWIGFACASRQQVVYATIGWWCMIACGSVFYAIYKFS